MLFHNYIKSRFFFNGDQCDDDVWLVNCDDDGHDWQILADKPIMSINKLNFNRMLTILF